MKGGGHQPGQGDRRQGGAAQLAVRVTLTQDLLQTLQKIFLFTANAISIPTFLSFLSPRRVITNWRQQVEKPTSDRIPWFVCKIRISANSYDHG